MMDLSADWMVTFNASHVTTHMVTLHSWTDEEAFKYYSGTVTYEKTIELPATLKSGVPALLDFGEATPLRQPDPLPEFSLRAYLEGPIREAAEVYVNGHKAGAVWRPPYTIEIASFLKAGKNDLRIIVGNTAINELAGHSLPDYRLLNDRYGERFVQQDMDHLQPLPSGLVAGLRLRITE